MIRLNLKRYEKKINVPPEIKETFKDPLITYLLSKKTSFYLNAFIIFDFQNENAIYLESATKENEEKFYNSKYAKENGIAHAIAPLKPGIFISSVMSFDTFAKTDKTFRVVNLLDNSMTIYEGKDVGMPSGLISDTFDRYEKNKYYVCMLKDKKSTYHEMTSDLKTREMFGLKSPFLKPPHHVIRYKNLLFSTGFFERSFKIGDRIFKSDNELKDYVYSEIKNDGISTDKTSFYDITAHNPKYKYEVMPGKVLVFNLDTLLMQEVPVGCSPSHVVIDDQENYAYILSNNITGIDGKVFYLAPGRLSKLKITPTGVEKVDEFYDNSGYRFTSHKLIRYNGHPYIGTIGHPNRLFMIDCHTMKEAYRYDIKKNILGNVNEDIRKFLNDVYNPYASDPFRYSALESRGDYVLLVNQSEVLFFSLKNRDIMYEIPYSLPDGYFQFTQHCDFIN
jgi:hypothetical protein